MKTYTLCTGLACLRWVTLGLLWQNAPTKNWSCLQQLFKKWQDLHLPPQLVYPLSSLQRHTKVRVPLLLKFGILLPKLFWPTVRKKCSSDQEKLLKLEAEGREFAKFFRSLDRTIYSNSERSEQILVTECFFNLFLEVSHN